MNGHSTRAHLNLAIDLDGVLTEHPRPLAIAASQKFGLDLPERAFVDSAGLNVPQVVRDWVYGEDGPASKLQLGGTAPSTSCGRLSTFWVPDVSRSSPPARRSRPA